MKKFYIRVVTGFVLIFASIFIPEINFWFRLVLGFIGIVALRYGAKKSPEGLQLLSNNCIVPQEEIEGIVPQEEIGEEPTSRTTTSEKIIQHFEELEELYFPRKS